jgi:hypothetical protein
MEGKLRSVGGSIEQSHGGRPGPELTRAPLLLTTNHHSACRHGPAFKTTLYFEIIPAEVIRVPQSWVQKPDGNRRTITAVLYTCAVPSGCVRVL